MPVRPEMPLDWFQSTPANFTAGDGVSSVGAVPASRFQSTPANFTAGDLEHAHESFFDLIVSIHARQFHSGRRSSAMEKTD